MSENVKKLRCRSQVLTETCNFEWSVENFRSICSAKTQDKESLISETFTTGESSLETKWNIKLEFNNNDTIGVFLNRISNKSLRYDVIINFSIVGSDKIKYCTEHLYDDSSNSGGHPDFVCRKKLFDEEQLLLLPNDTLTIVCEFQVSVIHTSIGSKLTQQPTEDTNYTSIMSENVKKFRCCTQFLKVACSFEWSIENFRTIISAKTRVKESLISETFTTGESSLESKWYIELDFTTHNDTIGVFLHRISNKSLHYNVITNFGIVGPDKIKYCTEHLWYGDSSNIWGHPNFIYRKKLFKEEQLLLLPNDTLTIVCEFQEVIHTSIVSKLTQELTEDTNYTSIMSENVKKFRYRTQLLKEVCDFEWSIENFSTICSAKTQDKEIFRSETFTTGESSLETEWCVFLNFSNQNSIGFGLKRLGNNLLRHYAIINFCIVGSDEMKYFAKKGKGRLYSDSSNSWGRPNCLDRKKLLLLPNDTLTIVCECQVSVLDASIVSELTQESNTIHSSTSDFENSASLMNNLQHLYTSQMFSDFTLKVGDEELNVHKKILCARSSVFNTMLNCDMNLTKRLEITDFDISIVKSMIHYIYCDKVQDLSPELSIKLYSIADKYNLQDLKNICVEYILEKPDSLKVDAQHLYTSQMFSDFTLKVGDEELQVHKLILCARSSVFNTMLNCDMKENRTNCLEITDFDPSIVKAMIHYIYCGQVQDFSPELSIKLYSIADKYNLQDLKDICVEYIAGNINIDNICDVLTLGELHDEPQLKSTARDFICANAVAIQETEKWLSLSKNMPHLIMDINRLVISQMKNTKYGININTMISIKSLYCLLVISILYFFILQ